MTSKSNANNRRCIGVSIPCYNEEDNIVPLVESLVEVFETELAHYDYRIQFIDNKSTDSTREKIEQICANNSRVAAIFNVKNFGFQSGYYGFLQARGDCVITMAADFQEPAELIPAFVEKWEQGAKIVCAVKSASEEGFVIRRLRNLYYRILKVSSDANITEGFSGFGLYDRSFIEILRELDEPLPYIRTLVAEFGYGIEKVPYEKKRRKSGKSKNNMFSLYDTAMRSLTSNSNAGIRVAFLLGFVIALASLVVAAVYFAYKLLNWNSFNIGIAPVVIGVFLFGGLQICLIALLGEFIISMNRRLMHRPLVFEERRVNNACSEDGDRDHQ